MKKLYLILIFLISTMLIYAQKSTVEPSDVMLPYYSDARNIEVPFYLQPNNTVHSRAAYNETVIGSTYWDLQSSNSAPPNRFYVYEDGTMAAVWTMGMDTENNYEDRGTGYAFFNGSTWDTMPSTRIETERAGWPSYSPAGSGEIIASHHNSMGIIINRRETVGEGEWMESMIPNPSDSTYLSWPRVVSSGDDNMTLHLLVNTYESYEGLSPAILYYRSLDAGQTWETEGRILEGMTSAEYTGFNTETYAWAEPKDNMLAFVVADRWTDLIVMKSDDNGDTWQKTVVWEHPYPMWNQMETDTFYSPDGAASIAFDNDGKLHLAFGVNRTWWGPDATSSSWFPFVDGIAYWNEDMPTWSNGSMEALNPDSLSMSGNLAATVQDLDADGQLDLVGFNASNLGIYYVGLSSMPQISVDDQNRIYLVYSAIAEGFDNGQQNYRHLWAQFSDDSGESWSNAIDLTGDSAQVMNESVFPTLASRSDENLHLIYQVDNEPGMSVLGDIDDPTDNSIIYMEVPKSIWVNTSDIPKAGFSISANFPNPFSSYTSFNISLEKASKVSLHIYDLTGRLVMQLPEKIFTAGNNIIRLNASQLTQGMYTYTFIVNGNTISDKMIVK